MTSGKHLIQELDVSTIELGRRLRPISVPHAWMLAKSIEKAGRVKQPIQVRPVGDGFVVTFGGHRFHAVAKLLNWKTIPAIVVKATADEALLDEIDENLHRYDLTALDRAWFLGKRAEIYLKQHPETKRGGKNQYTRLLSDTMSFSKETAERTGLSQRTIQRAIAIATGLKDELADTKTHEKLSSSPIALKQAELLALAKLEPSKRRKVLTGMLLPEPKWSSVRQASDQIAGRVKKEISKLDRAWQGFLALPTRDQRALQNRINSHLKLKVAAE